MAKNIAPNPAPGTGSSGAKPVNASGAPSKNTIMRPKAHNKDVDPTRQPMAKRPNVLRERGGATYGIQVGFEAHVAPEAGFTQANGRILPHAVKRSAPNFRVGTADHN